MKQAVRNAIEIYEREIAGRPVETNLDEIVDRALARAKDQVDKGQSALARATLRRAAEEMRRDEEERRERYIAGVTALYTQARDIALAAYDGDAAAEAVVELARALQNVSATKIATFLSSEAAALERHGDERGSNVHLFAAIALRRELLRLAVSDDERGAAHTNLGVALGRLGERESGTARLEEAVQAFRAALEELTRERVPLNWAITQINLGNALARLGERDAGTARLEEAVAAYRAALLEYTPDPVPLQWAMTQNNLGNALSDARGAGGRNGAHRGGGRSVSRGAQGKDAGSGFARVGDDTEQSRQCAMHPRRSESGTAPLEDAVAAYRAALEERTRERVPLQWAETQANLGNALGRLGERESGTAKLEEAVAAYRAALEERTRERVPLDWAASFGNQGVAMMLIADRTNGGALAETAVKQIEAAYETLREGGQQQWAAFYERQLPKAQAIHDRLKGK